MVWKCLEHQNKKVSPVKYYIYSLKAGYQFVSNFRGYKRIQKGSQKKTPKPELFSDQFLSSPRDVATGSCDEKGADNFTKKVGPGCIYKWSEITPLSRGEVSSLKRGSFQKERMIVFQPASFFPGVMLADWGSKWWFVVIIVIRCLENHYKKRYFYKTSVRLKTPPRRGCNRWCAARCKMWCWTCLIGAQ